MSWSAAAEAKRVAVEYAGTFVELVGSSQASTPSETKAQIDKDVPRTFVGLPVGCRPPQGSEAKAQAQLRRILLASEWRNANMNVRGQGASYTQGMGSLAGFCLGLCGWEEQAAFFLFSRLLEDVVGLSYFYEWPPMLGYHADVLVLQRLVPLACPRLAKALGNELEDMISLWAVQPLVTCFVNTGLSKEPLIALWSELLLDGNFDSVVGALPSRRFPLLVWFVGMLSALELKMLDAIKDADRGTQSALAFHAATSGVSELPDEWRPQNLLPPMQEVADMICTAQKEYLAKAESKHATTQLGIPSDLASRLQREFLALPQTSQSGIDEKTLKRVLVCVAPPEYSNHAAAIFALLDRDGTRTLDFYELMVGITALRENRWSRKLELLFQLYDTDGSGALEADELQCLSLTLAKLQTASTADKTSDEVQSSLRSLSERSAVPAHLRRRRTAYFLEELEEAERIKRRLLLMDADRDGRLSLEEWTVGAIADPGIKNLLACMGIRGSNARPSQMIGLPDHLAGSTCFCRRGHASNRSACCVL